MKEITEEDLKIIDDELESARNKFDEMNFNTLEEKLKWISNFFNLYVPELEKRFLTDEELKQWVFLPNEIRIKFYLYFPEHGLNMANYSQELVKEKQYAKKIQYVNKFYFRHDD